MKLRQLSNTEWLYQISSQQRPNLNIYFQNIILLSEWNENEWKEEKKPNPKPKPNHFQCKNLNNLAMWTCIPTLQFVRERWNSRGRPSYITSFVNTLTRSKAAGWSFYSGKQLHRSSTDSMEKAVKAKQALQMICISFVKHSDYIV